MDIKRTLNKMTLIEKIEQLTQIKLTRYNFEEMKEKLKKE